MCKYFLNALYELDAVLSALQKNLRSDSSRDFLRGHSRFTGIIRAIDFAQGGFEVRIRGGWFKFGSRTRVERHAAGATSQDGGQVDSVNQVIETGASGVLLELANGLGGNLQYFLVEQPFLDAEALGPRFPI